MRALFIKNAGALDTVECYDVTSAKWTSRAPMPYKLRTVKCAVVDDSIWVLAGYRYETDQHYFRLEQFCS